MDVGQSGTVSRASMGIVVLLLLVLVVLGGLLRQGGVASSETRSGQMASLSTRQLIEILQDPSSPYFAFVTAELQRRGQTAAEAAPFLAQALQYPRRDSYSAGFALIAMGPAAREAIPGLLQALDHERSDVRTYAAFALGAIGEPAKCAVPKLAEKLWDSSPEVRATTALALAAISGQDLALREFRLDPSNPGAVLRDEPEGLVSEMARVWWQEQGQEVNWLEGENLCEPL